MVTLEEMFDAVDDNEYLKFERVENKLHSRPDLHAFLLLDGLVPGKGRDMVSAAEHDVIYLDVSCDALASVITQEQVVELKRCGVRYESDVDSLALFV